MKSVDWEKAFADIKVKVFAGLVNRLEKSNRR